MALPAFSTHWTTEDVEAWLKDNGFGHFKDLFCKKNSIDGAALLMLTEADLKALLDGLPRRTFGLGDIKRFMLCLQKVQLENGQAIQDLLVTKTCEETDIKQCPETSHKMSVKNQHTSYGPDARLTAPEPEYIKCLLSFVYMALVAYFLCLCTVIANDRLPNMTKYPPLPDIILDNVPYTPVAFKLSEVCISSLLVIVILVVIFHKHRFIMIRRGCAIMATAYFLRAVSIVLTGLSVPSEHTVCIPYPEDDIWRKFARAFNNWRGCGMSMMGVQNCGDYMFSGHTVVACILHFSILEYTPRHLFRLRVFCWTMTLLAMFLILASHEHYTIDVFIGFCITATLHRYYHLLANNGAFSQRDSLWFPIFSYLESNVHGPIPNEYEFSLDKSLDVLLAKSKTRSKAWILSLVRYLQDD